MSGPESGIMPNPGRHMNFCRVEDVCTPHSGARLAAGGGIVEGAKPTAPGHRAALYLRSVCWITSAFCALRCHPLTCLSFKLRSTDDASPT